ncbi:MAG: segregation/condensation protein A [Angelakisella sp.]
MDKLSFNVNNGEYEGPLDLILHLISKHQLNIMDINISGLLEQYMEQIRFWQQNDLEVASEFLEMASRLVHIKTVGLLPKYKEEEDQAKAELMGQLLEYQACKQAAMLLAARNEGFGAFVRPPEEIPADLTYTRRHPIEQLTHSYWQAIGKGKRKLPPQSEIFSPLVARPFVSVSSKIVSLLRRFYKNTSTGFTSLFTESKSRSEMVATFLAVLELMKAKRIALHDEDDRVEFLGRNRALQEKQTESGIAGAD